MTQEAKNKELIGRLFTTHKFAMVYTSPTPGVGGFVGTIGKNTCIVTETQGDTFVQILWSGGNGWIRYWSLVTEL